MLAVKAWNVVTNFIMVLNAVIFDFKAIWQLGPVQAGKRLKT